AEVPAAVRPVRPPLRPAAVQPAATAAPPAAPVRPAAVRPVRPAVRRPTAPAAPAAVRQRRLADRRAPAGPVRGRPRPLRAADRGVLRPAGRLLRHPRGVPAARAPGPPRHPARTGTGTGTRAGGAHRLGPGTRPGRARLLLRQRRR